MEPSKATALAPSILLLAVLFLSGCGTGLVAPSQGQVHSIESGEESLLLLRVTTTAEGKALQPFPECSVMPDSGNATISLGSLETGGTLHLAPRKYFSKETCQQGWTYLVVPRGTLYVGFLPTRRGDIFSYMAAAHDAQKWRIEPSGKAKVVYGGTIALEGEKGFVLVGETFLNNITRMKVRDESDQARAIAQQFVPELGPVETALMRRQSGPLIFHTPTG